jgi:hypothetical protein
MPAITSANLADAIVRLIAAESMDPLMSNLFMGNLINRNYERTLNAQGDTVNIPIPPVMSGTNIAEGGSVTTQTQSLGNAQVVLNVHFESSFQIPDVTQVIAHPQLLSMYMQPTMIAVAERIESDIFNLYANLTANAQVGTSNTSLTESTIDRAETAMFEAKIPAGYPKFLAVSPSGYSDLRQISRFSESEKSPAFGNTIPDGTLGKIKDFYVLRSQLVPKVGNTTYNMAFVRDAMALVMRQLPKPLPGTGAIAEYAEMGNFGMRIVMSYQPNTLAQQFTVDVLYGVAVLRNVFGLVVLS